MYRYDDFDQRIVDQRVAQFRDQTRRFLAGEPDGGRVPPAAPAKRPLYPEARADAAGGDPVRICCRPRSCARSPISPASMTAATVISPPARTSSSTGRASRTRRRFSRELATGRRCTRSRPPAIACATSRATRWPALRATRSSIRARGPSSIRQWSTRQSRIRVPAAQVQDRGHRRDQDRPRGDLVHDIGAQAVRNEAGKTGFRVLVGGGQGARR